MSTSASAPVAAPAGVQPVRQGAYWLLQLATRRRMRVTGAVLTLLVVAHLVLWKTRPCDLFDFFDPSAVGGQLLILLGIFTRSWAAGTIHKSQALTTSGPYTFVRNPLYIGSFLMMFGFALLLRDWIAMWIIVGPILAMYLNKVRQEEVFLARIFPDSWPAYIEQTPRFVPCRLGRPSFVDFSWRQWAVNSEYQVIFASAIGLFAIWCWHRAMA